MFLFKQILLRNIMFNATHTWESKARVLPKDEKMSNFSRWCAFLKWSFHPIQVHFPGPKGVSSFGYYRRSGKTISIFSFPRRVWKTRLETNFLDFAALRKCFCKCTVQDLTPGLSVLFNLFQKASPLSSWISVIGCSTNLFFQLKAVIEKVLQRSFIFISPPLSMSLLSMCLFSWQNFCLLFSLSECCTMSYLQQRWLPIDSLPSSTNQLTPKWGHKEIAYIEDVISST